MAKEKTQDLLTRKREYLNKNDFFRSLSFGKDIQPNKKEADDPVYYESSKYKGLCFWLDQLDKVEGKPVNRYCFAYKIPENLDNKIIADNLPDKWWIGTDTHLDSDFFETTVFEYNVDNDKFELKDNEKNGIEAKQDHFMKLRNLRLTSSDERYICFYLKIGEEENSLDKFEQQFENFNHAWKKIMSLDIIKQTAELLKNNHNIILHGAPGTGKTFLAKEIAKTLIFPNKSENEKRNELSPEEQKQFNEQCKLIQFHQSYDYTDFVEGLRPQKKGREPITFERKNGTFKNFCQKALASSLSFDKAWNKLITMPTKGRNLSIPKLKGGSKGSQLILKKSKTGLASVDATKDRQWFTKEQCYNVYLGKPGTDSKALDNYRKAIVKYMINKLGLPEFEKKYVFIIDEINRGEMSKIFGELFFSIDPGYRGEKGRIETQYQNLVDDKDDFAQGFFVPENVYIIGTMNDIDRSVESMDFAMRRRFAFKEIEASDRVAMLEELGNNEIAQKAKNRMKNLNVAIENIPGLSRAYHIGPAYFLKLNNYNGDFEQLWTNHIKGLLTEYLRGMDNVKSKIDDLKKAFDNENSMKPSNS